MQQNRSSFDHERPPRIVGLSEAQLKRIRSLTKYQGPADTFFQEAVWWWRPLLKILGKNCRRISIPPRAKRSFFPPEFFEMLQQSEKIGDPGDTWNFLFNCEIVARLEGGPGSVGYLWPGFLSKDKLEMYGKTVVSNPVARLQGMNLDLRLSNAELVKLFLAEVSKMREAWHDASPFPVPRVPLKSSFLSEHTFARIELIDRRISMRDPLEAAKVVENMWANVTKIVRQRFVVRH